MRNVYIETYGCQMNVYDTEIVRAVLLEENYKLVDSVEAADVVMLNTCSVRENANRKIFGRVHAVKYQKQDEGVYIGVLGCMATDMKDKLVNDPKVPIDFVVGPDSYKRLGQVLKDVEKKHAKQIDVKLSKTETYDDIYPSRYKSINAWIAVMRGCNNFCSFCVVPYTRGRERSRTVESVVEETKRLADEGYMQVTLLGQNVNSYNSDGHDFAYLLDKVSQVSGIERIRFTSPHPKDFPDSLLQVMAENDKVCKQIHLPLQAGNSRILDIMRRTYTKEEYLELVDKIRSFIPSIVLSTDIIVGFPTETDEEFEDTVDVMKKVEYDSAFIFKYSERDHTLAQKHYKDDVSEETKTERIVLLNEIQKEISIRKNKAHIGQELMVLVEEEQTRKSASDMQGRTDGNKLVIFPANGQQVGDMIKVRINDATANVLKGKVVT